MPAKPLQPTREERRLTLARYFIEAVSGLLEAGETYGDLSVERLIKTVGVSRSTFYTYFTDKADLLVAMGEDVTRDLAEAGAVWFELAGPVARADLRRAIDALASTYRRHRMILGAVTEAAAYDANIRAVHGALVDRAVSELTKHLRKGQRSGTVATELDAARTAEWLVWMLERGLYQLVSPAARPEKQIAAVTALIWRGVYARDDT